MGSHIFRLGVRKFFIFTVTKLTRMFVLFVKSSGLYSLKKTGSIHFRLTYLRIEKGRNINRK